MTENANTDPLLDAAFKDLEVAQLLLQTDLSHFSSNICYSCQQATEKMVKVVYHQNNQEHPYTHSIDSMLKECRNNGWLEIDDLFIEDALTLSSYAAACRYEIGSMIDDSDVKEAVSITNELADILTNNGYTAYKIISDIHFLRNDSD